MKLPRPLTEVIEYFERLPGIGPKTAQRLAYHLLYLPEERVTNFGKAVTNLKSKIKLCKQCFNVCDSEFCDFCKNHNRDQKIICVVEHPLDIYAIEKSGAFKGLYHVLHGVINPLDNIGPDDIHLKDLIIRINNGIIPEEIIVATNPTMEGEATALYLQKLILQNFPDILISRIGRGLPTGADLGYADEMTLSRSFEGRRGL